MGSVSYLNENCSLHTLLLSAPAIHRQSSQIPDGKCYFPFIGTDITACPDYFPSAWRSQSRDRITWPTPTIQTAQSSFVY